MGNLIVHLSNGGDSPSPFILRRMLWINPVTQKFKYKTKKYKALKNMLYLICFILPTKYYILINILVEILILYNMKLITYYYN